jgi:[acyl-carrier-protein] S-malonyltransferase
VEVVRHMAAKGIAHVVECGPGKVLAGMTRRIEGGLQSYAFADAQSLQQALQTLKP